MADESKRPYVDPGHVLPDEDWAKVVARAAEIREEVQADAEGGASGVGGIVLDMTGLGVASRKYFGVSGIPTQLLVLHSAECPLQAGFAKSLTEWASPPYPAAPEASWHRFIDPVHRVRFVPDELGAWHASEANNLSIGWEQAGYARYSRDQWLTADGRTQLDMLALDMAEVAVRDGIPARWLSTAEVRAVLDSGNRSIKGFCTHRQIDPETRTDPGDGYPYDLLMERIIYFINGGQPAITEENDMTPEQAAQLAYIASPQFKADIFQGSQPVEVDARKRFYQELLNTDFRWFGFDGTTPEGGRSTTNIATDIGWADTRAAGLNGMVAGLAAKVDALLGLVADGGAAGGATKEEMLERLDASVRETFGQWQPAFVKADGQ